MTHAMNLSPSPAEFAASAESELHEGMLKFWLECSVDEENGGFHGEVDQEGTPRPDAEKGSVLNARILWSFSAVARAFPERSDYRKLADRAYDYLREHFIDPEFGGTYWSVDAQGKPLDMQKKTYGQAFAIFGLAEYYALTGSKDALESAVSLYELLEEHALETTHGGYLESLDRSWAPLEEMQLSAVDLPAPKSFNTNLHVLEAYTRLYRAWEDSTLHDAIADLLRIHLDEMFSDHTEHFGPFFTEDWSPISGTVTYGHDIEAAWLLHDAAELLDDDELLQRVRKLVETVAESTLRDGVDATYGGIFHKGEPDGEIDMDKHWWPQVEGATGFLDAWRLTGEPRFYDAAWGCWSTGLRMHKDVERGEWHYITDREGTPRPGMPKIGFWKCPYHGVRTCLEIIRRLTAPVEPGETAEQG